LVLALALHKYVGRQTALTLRQQLMILLPAVALIGSGAYIARRYRRAGPAGLRSLNFTLALNLAALGILLVLGEGAVRLLSVSTPLGSSFAGTRLLPKSWEETKARNAGLLAHAPANISYFVSDTLLGWTVGPNRASSDGRYFSSAEGVRSGRPGMTYAGRSARPTVAIVGDSYTFGLEIPFEDSWGARLETALGGRARVLNFGVDGYGVDQASLRYVRDARTWRPAVTVFGFIEDDLHRTLSVYSFISFPEWGVPFSKPRFILDSGELELLNVPVINPTAILGVPAIGALPFIAFDPGYDAAAWQWHWYDASRLVRFLLSRFPRYPAVSAVAGPDAELAINGALLRSFVARAVTDGTVPLLVYFPSRGDFSGQDRSAKDRVLDLLRRSGVPYLDMTPCLRAVNPARAFIPGRAHYSAEGNAAVARCLLPAVRSALERR
jgi:hypothetical protein